MLGISVQIGDFVESESVFDDHRSDPSPDEDPEHLS